MPTFREAASFWIRLGFINFGGPAGQISLMHRELVERRGWVEESSFLRALNFCMLLPGPEAQQLATYIGWQLHGWRGGLLAGVAFVVPSIFVLLLLSWVAVAGADHRLVQNAFYGVQPVVVAIIAEAVLRIGRRAIRHRALLAVSAAAFVAIYFLHVPFPFIVLGAGLLGWLLERRWPELFRDKPSSAGPVTSQLPPLPPLSRLMKLMALFLVLWLAVVGPVLLIKGTGDVLSQESLFFTKAAFVTFGGAYAVLSYISDVAVNHFHWLTGAQMAQGLGLAESTPGPLIMVTQYVGFVGGWNYSGANSPLAYAVAGGLLTTYVTFLPCFFFIFAGAPYIERLTGHAKLHAALACVTAAVVGVILNLGVFFAGRVLILHPGTMDLFACALSVLGFLAIWRFRMPVQWTVLAGAAIGILWKM